MSSSDVESLQSVPRSRGRGLDAFLLGSVLALFVMVLSGAALAVWTVRELRAEMARGPVFPANIARHTIDGFPPTNDSSYKMKNFAYLTPNYSEVKNGNMMWKSIKYGNADTVGSSYSYDSKNAVLTINQEGTYFLYTQLNLTCLQTCSEGTLSVTFELNNNMVLSCSLHLHRPGKTSHPAVQKCWTVIPQLSQGDKLIARMHLTMSPDNWKLDLNHSGFGMFLVD